MSDPHDLWLADAVEAARECARDDSPASLEGAATRSRIHASLERRRGTGKRRLTLLSAIVASMFGSTAFAYYSGWRPFSPSTPAPTVRSTEPAVAIRPQGRASNTSSTAPAPTTEEPTPTPSRTPNPSALADTAAKSTPALTSKSRRLAVPASTSSTPPTTSVVPPSPTPAPSSLGSSTTPTRSADHAPTIAEPLVAVPDAELAAYQRAHVAHFRGKDAERALAAWDAYLAQFPDGKLAPEARYDRALVLVKLKRWADARAALQPFASAPAGAYRQREAASILDAIRGR